MSWLSGLGRGAANAAGTGGEGMSGLAKFALGTAVVGGLAGIGIVAYNVYHDNKRRGDVVDKELAMKKQTNDALVSAMETTTAGTQATVKTALAKGDTATATAVTGQLGNTVNESHATTNTAIDAMGQAQATGNGWRQSDGTQQGGALTTNAVVAQHATDAQASVAKADITTQGDVMRENFSTQGSIAGQQIGAQAAIATATNPLAQDIKTSGFNLDVGGYSPAGAPNHGSTQDALSGVGGGQNNAYSSPALPWGNSAPSTGGSPYGAQLPASSATPTFPLTSALQPVGYPQTQGGAATISALGSAPVGTITSSPAGASLPWNNIPSGQLLRAQS